MEVYNCEAQASMDVGHETPAEANWMMGLSLGTEDVHDLEMGGEDPGQAAGLEQSEWLIHWVYAEVCDDLMWLWLIGFENLWAMVHHNGQ